MRTSPGQVLSPNHKRPKIKKTSCKKDLFSSFDEVANKENIVANEEKSIFSDSFENALSKISLLQDSKKKRKLSRTNSHFSEILGPSSTQTLQSFLTNVRSYNSKNPIRAAYSSKNKKQRDKVNSTSQNHIISDFYIQKILSKCIEDIKKLEGQDRAKQELSDIKKKAVLTFFDKIFHESEKGHFNNFLDREQNITISSIAQYVASHGSNNAVEGNASVNSGISKNMDAPRNSQGDILEPFAKMRDALMEFSYAVSLKIDSKGKQVVDKEVFNLVIEAITPNILKNGNARASSLLYKGNNRSSKKQLSKKRRRTSFEAPGALVNTLREFHTGVEDNNPSEELTETQAEHARGGYTFRIHNTP